MPFGPKDSGIIDAKQAVASAMQGAADILGQGKSSLEEIEREEYKGREVWAITLGMPRNLDVLSPLAQIRADPIQYKRFLIDAETGEMLAMVMREPASR